MLLDTVSATQSFSDLDASEESCPPTSSGTDRPRRPVAEPYRPPVNPGDRTRAIAEGDQVVFARLDVAEALGIWRHARGRVVETHAEAQAALEGTITIDVKFDGHETLHRYLPDLFEKRTR